MYNLVLTGFMMNDVAIVLSYFKIKTLLFMYFNVQAKKSAYAMC